jgi:hypothetical protein
MLWCKPKLRNLPQEFVTDSPYWYIRKNKLYMKKVIFLLIPFYAVILFCSCKGNGNSTNSDSTKNDTAMYDITRPIGNNYLEDLLLIKDEAELKTKFGKDAISYDTIWGMEGNFTMGSFINDKGKNEVQIMWKDSLHRTGILSAMIIAKMNQDGNYSYDNQWTSQQGIKLGMTSDEIEKINGKAFSLWGFGWDNGGAAGEWKKGNLENSGVGITFSEGNTQGKCSEKELETVMGDQMIMSDNAVVKKIQPKVVMLSVYQR